MNDKVQFQKVVQKISYKKPKINLNGQNSDDNMVKKSELEADAKKIMESFNDDYEIPTSGMIAKPIFKGLSVVYIMHFLAVLLSCAVYSEKVSSSYVTWLCIYSLVSCVILTGVAFMVLYGNMAIVLCINKEVLKESILAKIIRRKIYNYALAMVLFNGVVAVLLVMARYDFIIGYGFSWFTSFLLTTLAFTMSMSRYMTPAVTATFSKIGEFLSSSKDGKNLV